MSAKILSTLGRPAKRSIKIVFNLGANIELHVSRLLTGPLGIGDWARTTRVGLPVMCRFTPGKTTGFIAILFGFA